MVSDDSTGTNRAPSRAVSHYLNNLWRRPFLPLIFTLPSGNEVYVLHPAHSCFSMAYVGPRFLPVMIGRIMLSLRKAADRPLGDWSIAELSTNDRNIQSSIRFRRPQRSLRRRRDSISLDTISGSQAATQ